MRSSTPTESADIAFSNAFGTAFASDSPVDNREFSYFDEQHENRGYENLIEKIIEAFKKDLKIKNNIENMPNKIEELFYGIRKLEDRAEYFSSRNRTLLFWFKR